MLTMTDCSGRPMDFGDTVVCADPHDDEMARCGSLVPFMDGVAVMCGDGDLVPLASPADAQLVTSPGETLARRAAAWTRVSGGMFD